MLRLEKREVLLHAEVIGGSQDAADSPKSDGGGGGEADPCSGGGSVFFRYAASVEDVYKRGANSQHNKSCKHDILL